MDVFPKPRRDRGSEGWLTLRVVRRRALRSGLGPRKGGQAAAPARPDRLARAQVRRRRRMLQGQGYDGGRHQDIGARLHILRALRLALWRDRYRRERAFHPPRSRPIASHGPGALRKGRAAPELVYHRDRLLYPLKRTRPKGDPDPGWQRISWDEALELTAARLRKHRRGVTVPRASYSAWSRPSTSASDDSMTWIQRLMHAFGSPNLCRRDGAVRLGSTLRDELHVRRAGARTVPARPRERRLHPVLGLQPKPRAARPRDRDHRRR